MKEFFQKFVRYALPFMLGGGILYWMYRNMPFARLSEVLIYQMRWEWMLLSFVPGIMAQVFRGLRWRQSLEPLGERPSHADCIDAVYLSYATSLVVPRIGEFVRCGMLARFCGTSFAKAIGTVVTERAVDTVIVMALVSVVIFSQLDVFGRFFNVTGVSFGHAFSTFTTTGIWVTVFCFLALCFILYWMFLRLRLMQRVRSTLHDMMLGIMSLRHVRNVPLYVFYSLGIWVSYFFHYYLTFKCFSFTEDLSIVAGLVSFCVGTIAVVVPTPNGAGPWHFAVKTILVLYGMSGSNAILFALIVHTVQTFLLVVLGLYAAVVLPLRHHFKHPVLPGIAITPRRVGQFFISLGLAAIVLCWLYRDFPFSTVGHVLSNDVRWGWMAVSLLFGIIPQVVRGLRWRRTLAPLGYRPSASSCINAVFMSFGLSLIIPRIGEVARCTFLTRDARVPFTKSFGTVVTERMVDALLMAVVIGLTFAAYVPTFVRFMHDAGFDSHTFFARFSLMGILVSLLCLAGLFYLVRMLISRFNLKGRFSELLANFVEGLLSLRHVDGARMYAVETLIIWVSYFLHFYLAFYAFPFTSFLTLEAGLLCFCLISLAVLVPTPNGAGPWHFAVKVALMLFGILETQAIMFAFIVHALQTLLVAVLAFYGYTASYLFRRKNTETI